MTRGRKAYRGYGEILLIVHVRWETKFLGEIEFPPDTGMMRIPVRRGESRETRRKRIALSRSVSNGAPLER